MKDKSKNCWNGNETRNERARKERRKIMKREKKGIILRNERYRSIIKGSKGVSNYIILSIVL
jgi:hypothetical protein